MGVGENEEFENLLEKYDIKRLVVPFLGKSYIRDPEGFFRIDRSNAEEATAYPTKCQSERGECSCGGENK